METNTGGPSWLPLASLEEDIGSYVTGRMPSRYVGTPFGVAARRRSIPASPLDYKSRIKRISHTIWLMWGQDAEQRNSR